jgi:hypothetical protein
LPTLTASALIYICFQGYLSYADRLQDYSLLEEAYGLAFVLGFLAWLTPYLRLHFGAKRCTDLEQSAEGRITVPEPQKEKLMARKKLRRESDFIIGRKPNATDRDSESG